MTSISSFTSTYSSFTDADSINSRQPGPGRTMNRLFTAAGQHLENFLGVLAPAHPPRNRTRSMGGYQRSRSLPPPIPTSQASNISSQSSHPALPSLPSNISPGLMAVAVPISYAQTFLPPGTVNSDGSSYTWMVLPAGGSICPSQVQSDPVTKPRRASPVDRNRDDPEELMLFATDTCLSYFNCERFEHQKPELRVLMAKMRRLAEPLRLKQEDDRIIIRRRRNDILFHDLNRFVDGMVPLLADFVFHCPPFIFELPRRLRNQVLHVFDGPQNEPWVASVREYFRR